jgi:hypothetical protein
MAGLVTDDGEATDESTAEQFQRDCTTHSSSAQ